MKNQSNLLVLAFFLFLFSCKKESTPVQSTGHVRTSTSDEVFKSASRLYKRNISLADFFEAKIDNPWMPLKPGTIFHYLNKIYEDGDVSEEHDNVTVTYHTKNILGVNCRVVHDQIKVDNEITEDTYDWYAQDRFGNIWYFGEDTKEFDDDGSVDSSGSFEAGVNGALPGIVMLAHPEWFIGFAYYQEYSPADDALDQAQVTGINGTANVAYGSFNNCLITKEFTALEPGDVENKYYAYGLGQVLSVQKQGGNERDELVSITHY